MYITAALTLIGLVPAALTAPGTLGERTLPDHTPVTILGFDSTFDTNCGKTTVAGSDIDKAVEWGTNLKDVGQTLGSNNYPHGYRNSEKFKFPTGVCSSATNRLEFPVVKNDYYDGSEDATYKFRVIFVHDPNGSPDAEGKPTSTYCGTIYHAGGGNEFSGCDITK